jgi:hypothetical protein
MGSIFDKHIGNATPVTIGGLELNLKPLGIEHLSTLFKVMKIMEGAKKNMTEEEQQSMILNKLSNPEISAALATLVMETLKKSCPGEDLVKMSEFGMIHAVELFPIIINLNMETDNTHEAVKKTEIIERLREAQNAKPTVPQ